jgi:hypothetical protein
MTVLKHKDYDDNKIHDWELGQKPGGETREATREDHK